MLVFVDTNVWYPVVLADLVLRSVEIGLFDLAWTDESLTEVERVLVERKGLSAANAAVFGAQVRATAPEGRIGPAADVGRTCRVVLIESSSVLTRIPPP
jgi:predicted nucleic acid-binding protein